MQYFLENKYLKITVNSLGAELTSIVNLKTGAEYIWNADPAYWKRSAPVLFPIVGGLKNKEFRYEGKTYPMGQHGFARDKEFTLLQERPEELWFQLQADQETLRVYPFAFVLEIGYRLEDKVLSVIWRVRNCDEKTMYFSIGGHPAFMCPLQGKGAQTDYFLEFDTDRNLTYSQLSENGLVEKENLILYTQGGILPIDAHLFDKDALIIEKNQAHVVSLCDAQKRPYVTVKFDAPLFGLWSPAGKGAPFICIEPWYGRCDKEKFEGTLAEREYGNALDPWEVFEKNYIIEIGD